MRPLTPTVTQFVFDFVIDDIKKVIGCTTEEAKDVLHEVFVKHVHQPGAFYSRSQSPVLERKEPEEKRPKAVYSNQKNTWDKYSD